MNLEIIPITGIPEIKPGDDLPSILARELANAGVRTRDVVAVTQKIVSKAEGMLVAEGPEGKESWVRANAVRIVAQRGEMIIAETHHGFVCANAGVDASNVPEGYLTLLPEDPDASASRIRKKVLARASAQVAVVVTDTFGRPWRRGVVDVAIGASGLPSLIDLRGSTDATGRALDATVLAYADQIAAAAGLVMGKADGIPAAIVRGLRPSGDPPTPATQIIRPPEEDLFRSTPLAAIGSRRTIRTFGGGSVARAAVEEAVKAACTAPAPHHSRPWMFIAIDDDAERGRLLDAMEAAWRADLEADGVEADTAEGRIARSRSLLGGASTLIIPLIRTTGAHAYPDPERQGAERQMYLLSMGAAIENLLLALHSQGLGAAWVSASLFCKDETRSALGLEHAWAPMGAIAVGTLPEAAPVARPPLVLGDHLRWSSTHDEKGND